MKKYICPHCKKEQERIAEAQTGTQIYEDIPSYGDFEGNHDKWQCPECGKELEIEKDLPKELLKQLE